MADSPAVEMSALAILALCVGPVTLDVASAILRDEEGHRRLFEGFLREHEVGGLT
jgi:ferritin-like protein